MSEAIRVAELFAGVGGFRLGLDGYHDKKNPQFNMPAAGPFETVWANQWEPKGTPARQFAARCYEAHFGEGSVVNEDINKVLDEADSGEREIPAVDMVVGGFPCQDYSVAKPLSQAHGIEGKKGVLWWDIYRFLKIQQAKGAECARYVLLENVDRLLKSPAPQRGRDFAIILSCLADLGYSVEWRVINSAEYGFPQRRKRVYVYAERDAKWDIDSRIQSGVMAGAFPIKTPEKVAGFDIPSDPYEATKSFGLGAKVSPFREAGVMQGCHVLTCPIEEDYSGVRRVLRDVLMDEASVPESFYVPDGQLPRWEFLKGSKREKRTNKHTGETYYYSEGKMSFPDAVDNPSRTILTGEGGSGPSRFKHVVEVSGRLRRLLPDELEQLQGFPRGWTNTGMTDGNRAFCMGNALVVGIPHLIGKQIAKIEDAKN